MASKKETGEIGLKTTVKGHIGDGNFHENIYYDATNPKEIAKAERLIKSMVRRAIEMEGACIGEHGIGFGKKSGLQQEVGEDTITVMVSLTLEYIPLVHLLTFDQKLLKTTLDPHWITYVVAHSTMLTAYTYAC